MIDVKLSTCAPQWPWARQTPGSRFEWGGFRFHVDVPVDRCDAWVVFEALAEIDGTFCPRDRVVFIAGEPDSIGGYKRQFLEQFAWVVSGRNDIGHSRQIRIQQAHPWFVEKSFDELMEMSPIPKTRDVCVISSDKAFTDGHQRRLDFVSVLKASLGERIDVWGRGIRSFDSKWEVLAPYRYAVVLENFAGPDFLTEKLPDALLAYCFPLYFGCTNTGRYFDPQSWMDVDIAQPEAAAALLQHLLADPGDYERRLPAVSQARRYYLNNLQFYANLSGVLQTMLGMTNAISSEVVLQPNHCCKEDCLEAEIEHSAMLGPKAPSWGQAFARLLRRNRP